MSSLCYDYDTKITLTNVYFVLSIFRNPHVVLLDLFITVSPM
jgi:hypothetical protein